MGMNQMPEVTVLRDRVRCWTHRFDRFRVKVRVPPRDPLADRSKFGVSAPYLLVFE